MTDWDQWEQCLVCSDSKRTMFSLQEVLAEFDGFTVAEILIFLNLLKITDVEHLSQSLCFKCVSKMQTCFDFKVQCSKIEKTLHSRTENISTGPRIESVFSLNDQSAEESANLDAKKHPVQHFNDNDDNVVDGPSDGNVDEQSSFQMNPTPEDWHDKDGSLTGNSAEVPNGNSSILETMLKSYESKNIKDESISTLGSSKIKKKRTSIGCPICNQQFKYNICLNKHMAMHKRLNMVPDEPNADVKHLDLDTKLSAQQKADVTESPRELRRKFKCAICTKIFHHENAFKQHIYAEHSDQNKPAAAEQFRQRKPKLINVETIDNYDKRYQCNICGLTYDYSHNLCRHMRVNHPGYNKNEVGSSRGSGIQNEASAMLASAGKFPKRKIMYKKKFAERRKIGARDRPFACNFCGISYNHRSNLYRHKRKKHPRVDTVSNNLRSQATAINPNIDQFLQLEIKEYPNKHKPFMEPKIRARNKPYKCNMCDCSYFQLVTLQRHKRFHHHAEDDTESPDGGTAGETSTMSANADPMQSN